MEEPNKENEKALSEEILADAKRRAERIVARARAEAQKVVAAAEAEAGAAGEAAFRDVERRLAREQQVFEAGLIQEERMRRLGVEGRLLDEAFAGALAKLRSREGLEYRRVLRDLGVAGVSAMQGGAFVLRLSKADAALGAALAAEVAAGVREKTGRAVKVEASEAPGPFEGGVVIESAGGTQRVDNSFAGRLARIESDLRFEVADILFGKAGAAAGEKTP